jgi:hypothetical protein
MKEQFRTILAHIDSRLPSYFLAKGGRLQVAPLSHEEYEKLIANGYEPLGNEDYSELDKKVLGVLNKLLSNLGNRAILLFPFAVSTILAHEAGREGSELYEALRGTQKSEASPEVKEEKKQKRKKE